MSTRKQHYKSALSYQLSALKRYPFFTILSFSLAIFAAYLTTLPGIIVGEAVDVLDEAILRGEGLPFIFINLCIQVFIVALGVFFSTLAVGYVFANITWRWYRDAIQEFFEHIQDKSMTFHDSKNSKQLLAIAMQDIRWVRFSLNPALRNLVTAIGSLLITSWLLATIDIVLGVIMVIGTPLYLFFAYRYAVTIEPLRRLKSEENENLTSITQEVFRGIEVVKAFGKESDESVKFSHISKRYESIQAKEGRLAAFYYPVLIFSGMTALSFLYIAVQVLNGIYSVGTLVKVLGMLAAVDAFSFMLPRFLLVLRGAHVNAQRIINILNYEDLFTEPTIPETNINWVGDIQFDNVSFSYNNSNDKNKSYALKDITLTIPGGSRVALIGGPGGGKSTFLKMLLRFYDPETGIISVDGIPLTTIHTKDVRAAVGLVEQEIFLFRKTIRDNISFGRPDATDERIIEAAKRAQAHEFIVELPQGYDTVIGERGMTLSGGQRQRIAIARTLLHGPKLLLLDDSVSAIDAQTEFSLRKALHEVTKNRTSITVTQRLRTLLESDLIIIIDKGRIIDIGSHDVLLKSSKRYQSIFERLPGALPYVQQLKHYRKEDN